MAGPVPPSPNDALSLAFSHLQAGRRAQAAQICEQGLRRWPNHLDLMHLLAVLTHQLGNHAGALDLLNQVIRLYPRVPQPYNSLGGILDTTHQHPQAVQAYRQAIALQPDFEEAHGNLGNSLLAMGLAEQAEPHLRFACQRNPTFPTWLIFLGGALRLTGKFHESITCFESALRLAPGNPRVRHGLGVLLISLGQATDGITQLRTALSLQPNLTEARQSLLLDLHYDSSVTQEAIFAEHIRWAAYIAETFKPPQPLHSNDPNPARRLRIGYVSPNFHRHSVVYFLEPILASHDHSNFEIACYSDAYVEDVVTQRMRSFADFWRDTRSSSDEQLADQIRTDGIDILIDLAGHTGQNRLSAFSLKLAPIQITYLGYPDTTGLSTMDYRLTDSLSDPPGQTESWHTEKLLRLDPCFLCYRPPDDASDIAPPPAQSTGHITFGSFNNFAKASDSALTTWASILRSLPTSRLLLKARGLADPPTLERIRSRLHQLNLPLSRIDFQGTTLDPRLHFDQYHRIDIALDPFPYNGTTTTCDSLWMGVPVITLTGRAHASRVGTSLLSCVGLQDCISSSPEHYIQLAIELATDPSRLAQLRSTMRQRLSISPLLQPIPFTSQLEKTYRATWRTWCQTHSGNPAGGQVA